MDEWTDDEPIPWQIFHVPHQRNYPGHVPFDFKQTIQERSGYLKPKMSSTYRRWRNLDPALRPKEPFHQDIVEGRFPIYGQGWMAQPDDEEEQRAEQMPPGLRPIHGPISFDEMYQGKEDFGPEFEEVFSPLDPRYQGFLLRIGYLVDRNLTMGDVQFDNSIWIVKKVRVKPFLRNDPDIDLNSLETYQFDPSDTREYIAKVVSSRYIYAKMEAENIPIIASEMMKMAKKEMAILRHLIHSSIIRVIQYSGIQSAITGFQNVYMISIMDKMDGSLEGLKELAIYQFTHQNERRFKLPQPMIKGIIIQMGSALNYIHNNHATVGYAIAHQAIRPENILYRFQQGRFIFKLTDFEDCIQYPSSQIHQGQPFDFLPPNTIPYVVSTTSQDYRDAFNDATLRPALRTFPNDIWQLGITLIYLTAGNRVDAMDRNLGLIVYLQTQMGVNPQFPVPPAPISHFMQVMRLMTMFDPQQRITSANLVNHPEFRAIVNLRQ